MERILVSSCLMGLQVRYHGGDALVQHHLLQRWHQEGRLVPLCPEVAAGLSVPRARAEIANGTGGAAVIHGRSHVFDEHGTDVTAIYRNAAAHAVTVAKRNGVRLAILKDGSPSCGTSFTYDGSFVGTRVAQMGVIGAALSEAGVVCYDVSRLEEVARYLASIDVVSGSANLFESPTLEDETDTSSEDASKS